MTHQKLANRQVLGKTKDLTIGAKMHLIAFKASDTETQLIDDLIRFKRYKSRSAVIRAALDVLSEKYRLKPGVKATLQAERRRRGTRDMSQYYG